MYKYKIPTRKSQVRLLSALVITAYIVWQANTNLSMPKEIDMLVLSILNLIIACTVEYK